MWEPENSAEIPALHWSKSQSINKSKKRFIKEGEKTVSLYPCHPFPRWHSLVLRDTPLAHDFSHKGKWEYSECPAFPAAQEAHSFLLNAEHLEDWHGWILFRQPGEGKTGRGSNNWDTELNKRKWHFEIPPRGLAIILVGNITCKPIYYPLQVPNTPYVPSVFSQNPAHAPTKGSTSLCRSCTNIHTAFPICWIWRWCITLNTSGYCLGWINGRLSALGFTLWDDYKAYNMKTFPQQGKKGVECIHKKAQSDSQNPQLGWLVKTFYS